MRVHTWIDLDARIADVERLWFDLGRRSAFVEGFHHVHRADAAWPQAGDLVWDPVPGAGRRHRGRVREHVERFEARVGQTATIEDALSEGTQVVGFTALGDGRTRLDLRLTWRTKVRRLGPLADLYGTLVLAPRRREEMRTCLIRFKRELADELGP